MRDWSPVMGLPLWVWLFVLPSCLGLLCLVFRAPMQRALRPVWVALDRVYLASGVIAAGFMVTILLLIVAQMIARWTGVTFPGSTEFAGYAMACTSFFALAHALTRGAHIRVSIFLNMSPRIARWLDPFAIFLSAVIATYFARYAVKTTLFSEMLNDRTQGQDRIPAWLVEFFRLDFAAAAKAEGLVHTPIWIPQLAMSFGTVLLAICLWDMLTRALATGESPVRSEAVE